MTRDDMVATVEGVLAARMSGDFSSMDKLAAPDASFVFNGTDSLVTDFPKKHGATVSDAAIALFEELTLHKYTFDETIAEDNRLAVMWHGTFSMPGSEPFEATLFSRWQFGEDGRVSGIIDFFDTALLIRKLAEARS